MLILLFALPPELTHTGSKDLADVAGVGANAAGAFGTVEYAEKGWTKVEAQCF